MRCTFYPSRPLQLSRLMGFLRPVFVCAGVLSVARPRVVMVARFLLCVARSGSVKRDIPTLTPYVVAMISKLFNRDLVI